MLDAACRGCTSSAYATPQNRQLVCASTLGQATAVQPTQRRHCSTWPSVGDAQVIDACEDLFAGVQAMLGVPVLLLAFEPCLVAFVASYCDVLVYGIQRRRLQRVLVHGAARLTLASC